MARYTRTQVTQLSANEQAAINNINKNFEDLETAIQDTVSRSGNTPTHMTHDLDMNGKRIINVPAPTVDTDLVRRKDVVEDMAAVQTLVNTATNASAQALEAAQAVEEVLEDSHVVIVADDLALGDDSKIKKVADDIDDVSTVANNMSAINTANSNITNIDKVADDINNVNTTAANINNVNTCANNMSAINDAPNQASAAAGSASDASGYAIAAAASASAAALSAASCMPILFDFKWSDHEIDNMAWLRADTFSWQSGSVYKTAYDHLFNDVGYVRYMVPDDDLQIKFYRAPSEDTEMYAWTNQFSTLYTESEFPQNGDDFYYHNQVYGTVLSTGIEFGSEAVTPTTETVGSYTITYYPCADGHKVVLADQETTAANIYNESGVAWYYVLDTTNQRFKLPRTKFGFTGLRDTVGKYVPETYPQDRIYGFTKNSYGTTSKETVIEANKFVALASNNDWSFTSLSSTDAVQQRATQMYLYFYVGQFSQSATEQTAGLNSELFNGKVDLNAANLSTAGKSLISGLGMPSDTYEDLTFGVSGTSYTAPANGYVQVAVNGTSTTGFIAIQVREAGDSNKVLYANQIATTTGQGYIYISPVVKGQTFYLYYANINTSTPTLRFIYSKGSESEAS